MNAFNTFLKIVAPKSFDEMRRFVSRVNESFETLYDKVFGLMELSDMSKQTQSIINSKADGDDMAEIAMKLDAITQTVRRGNEERSNVTQNANRWAVKVEAAYNPLYRNYIRYGKPSIGDSVQSAYIGVYRFGTGALVPAEDVPITIETKEGFTAYCVDNTSGNAVYVGVVVDNSEAVSEQSMKLGVMYYPSTNADYMVNSLAYDDDEPTPLYRIRGITANAWNAVIANYETEILANGKTLRTYIKIPSYGKLYIADLFIEKNDAAAAGDWTDWIHTPNENTFKTFSVEHDAISVSDEDGALGNVPAGATKIITILVSEWDGATKRCRATVAGYRSAEMVALCAPMDESADVCASCNARCVDDDDGALIFECDTIPSDAVSFCVVILGGLAVW